MSDDHPLSIRESVINHLSSFCLTPPNKISDQTRLERDLGMTGDDADEYMDSFFRTFAVSPEGYQFDDYFHPEADWIWRLFFRRRRADVAVSDLIRSAAAGRWLGRSKAGG